jgi:hypothetical protein
VPNLITDRVVGVAFSAARLNVRRLMYQSLIWPAVLRDEPRRLLARVDSEGVKRLANSLVDGVRGNAELGGDLLRAEVLVDKAQAVELAGAQASDALGNGVVRSMA